MEKYSKVNIRIQNRGEYYKFPEVYYTILNL